MRTFTPLRAKVAAVIRPVGRGYASQMQARQEEALVAAIASDPEAPTSATARRALARFTLDACSLARDAENPLAAVEETFDLVERGFAHRLTR
ncbi:hypothetical protein [Amycolatopsis sp. NPDC051102]|uniref:hypothetical protein n=1 Tax=Amycolatopsis sp. NPDC051102 TaxID=3155163 RepID=UPI0034266C56